MTGTRTLICGVSPLILGLVPLARAAGIEVIGLWEPVPESGQAMARQLGIDRCHADLESFLNDSELVLVIVCTSPYQQASTVEKALCADKQVLCTLPCCSLDQRWVQLPPLRPKSLFLGQALRFLPAVRRMRHLLRVDRLIGRLQVIDVRLVCGPLVGDRYDWTCDSQMGGGLLNLHGTALLDLIWHLTRRRFADLEAMRRTYTRQTDRVTGIRQITADDFCLLRGELEDDKELEEANNRRGVSEERTAVVVNMNCHAPIGQFELEMTLIGSLGRLILRGASLYHSSKAASTLATEECILDDPLDDVTSGDLARVLPPPYRKGWTALFKLLSAKISDGGGEFWECAPGVTDWDQLERNMASCDGRPGGRSKALLLSDRQHPAAGTATSLSGRATS